MGGHFEEIKSWCLFSTLQVSLSQYMYIHLTHYGPAMPHGDIDPPRSRERWVDFADTIMVYPLNRTSSYSVLVILNSQLKHYHETICVLHHATYTHIISLYSLIHISVLDIYLFYAYKYIVAYIPHQVCMVWLYFVLLQLYHRSGFN